MAQRLVTQTDDNPIPSYVPIYDRLYADIVDGVYPAGTQLPGEAALAEKYGVSRNTLRQALTILNEDRMIRKKQGKGTFITYDPSRRSVLGCHVNPVLDCALQAVDEIKMSYNYGPPTEVAQQKLGIRASDIVMASDNLYCSEGACSGIFVRADPSAVYQCLQYRFEPAGPGGRAGEPPHFLKRPRRHVFR